MKKFFIGVVAVFLFLIVYWKIEAYNKDKICIFPGGATGIEIEFVEAEHVSGWIISGGHFPSWNYTYTIKDRNLYLRVYNLSFLNPEAEHTELKIDIDAGYNDFDNIYKDNGENNEPILIWSKTE